MAIVSLLETLVKGILEAEIELNYCQLEKIRDSLRYVCRINII